MGCLKRVKEAVKTAKIRRASTGKSLTDNLSPIRITDRELIVNLHLVSLPILKAGAAASAINAVTNKPSFNFYFL